MPRSLADAAAAAAAVHPALRSRRRLARAALLGAVAAAAGYGAWRLYRSDGATSARAQLARLRAAVAAYADAFGTGADTLRLLLADLRAFLLSDARELPPSLRQLARLMQTPEAAGATSATVAALLRGAKDAAAPGDGAALAPAGRPGPGALDRALEALLSERGQGLVGVAVSLAARNMVLAFCEAQHAAAAADAAAATGPRPPDTTARLLGFLASPAGQRLAVAGVGAFVAGGMRAYLEGTLDLNLYEDLFSAMAKPQHLEAVKQVVSVFARDVVGAYLAGPGAVAPQQLDEGGGGGEAPHLRGAASFRELRGAQGAAAAGGGAAGEAPGSPCGSCASGGWASAEVAAVVPGAPSDIDSDVLLARAEGAKGGGGGGDSARSAEAAPWAVRTPPGGGEGGGAQRPALPALRRVQRAEPAPQAGLQREGSGNLEWISAVGKEWLNVAQHPQGRTVMVELAGAAAKEAARGASAALVDQLRLQWLLVAALAAALLAWLAQRLLATALG